jgi:hypothetical protein
MRKLIRSAHLVHIAAVAEGITDRPDVAAKFQLQPVAAPYTVFRTAAGGMMADAASNQELLVQHGLTESSLEALQTNLQKFDDAVNRFNTGRAAHVGASAELGVVARDVVHIVSVMNGFNRGRFADDAELLAAWESASTTFAPTRSVEKAGGGTKTA